MVRFPLRVLAAIILAVGLVGPVPAIATVPTESSVLTAPAELEVACALKSNGLLRAVTSPSECAKNETPVAMSPGPVLLCVQPSGSVRYTKSAASCKRPARVVTVPPMTGAVYFCAAPSGVLRLVDDPALCGPDETPYQVTPSDDAPTLVSSTPADGATGLSTTTTIELTFSESVSAQPDAFALSCGGQPQELVLTGLPGTTATLTPTQALPEGAECTLTVTGSGVTDTDTDDPPDTMAGDVTVTFDTDAAPTVTAISPLDGATGVATDSTVTVTFSEPVDVTAASFDLSCAATPVGFTVAGSGTDTVVLTPTDALPETSACAVTVNAALVSDSDAGDPPDTMAADVSAAFTTVDAAPVVTATTPLDGATDVSSATTVEVVFSEPVTVEPGAFTLTCAVEPIAVSVSTPGPATTFTLTPATALTKGATCTVTAVAAHISDVDGIDPANPAADYPFSFAVAANSAPTAIDLDPTAVAENSPVGTMVGTLSTTDDDAGDTFTYALVAGAGADDNALFTIDGAALKTLVELDAEESATRTIRVRSTDAAGSSVEAVFVIEVIDVNETPSEPALTGDEIDENEPSGTTVGTLAATDPDVGQSLTFTLVTDGCGGSYPDGAFFDVSGTTLVSAASFNYEAVPSYTICVRVTDSGSPPLSNDKAFTITVRDVNDAPVAVSDGTYSGVIGNTLAALQRDATPGPRVALVGNVLIANDTDEDGDVLTAVAETVATTGGGTATIFADGSFTYLPGVGDVSQQDTFTYQVSDGTATATATVTLAIGAEIVWYVDSASSPTGADGRSTSPFTSLGPVNAAPPAIDADGPGHVISVRTGTGPYAGGLVLEADQRLVGAAEALVVGGVTLLAAGPSPAVITNATGNGLDLANGVDVRGVAVSNASVDGIRGVNVTTATVGTATTSVPVSGSTGDGVELVGGNGAVTLHTPITTSGSRSVAISNRTGGTVSLPRPVTGRGVELSGNTGSTIAFAGTLVLTTTTTPAFSATGGGTVTATATDSTLASTTGTALTVDATTIGAAHLTFRSVSATGAVNGIRLNATGSSGGLRVLGGGSTTQGGNASGGTIQATTGPGVLLTSTADVRLNNLSVLDVPTASGIKGTAVNGFMFTNGRIDGSGLGGSDVTASNLAFNTFTETVTNLTGAVTVSNSALRRARGSGIDIYNRAGTISSLTVSGNLVESTTSTATSAGSAVLVQALGSANTAASIGGGSIANNIVRNFPNGGGVLLYGGNVAGSSAPATTFGSASTPVVVSGNSVRGESDVQPLNTQCVLLAMAGRGTGVVNVTSNGTVSEPLGRNRGNCISVNSTGAFTLASAVTGNFVSPGSGQIGGAHGISGGADNQTVVGPAVLDTAVLNLTVSNNVVSQVKGSGIRFLANSSGTLRMRLQNNTVAAPTEPSGSAGIRVDSGTSGGSAVNTTVCLQISGNTTAGSTSQATGDTAPGIGLRKQGADAAVNAFGIVGLSPSPAVASQTVAYVSGQNPASAPGTGGFGTSGTYIVAGNFFVSCTLPF
jgi:large repetitive protein